MKFVYTLLVSVFILSFTSCKRETPYDFSDSPENTMIYMVQAKKGANGVYAATISQPFPSEPDSIYKISFGAYYPGNDPAPANIDVTFALDYSKLDSINAVETENGRPVYTILPDSVYTLDGLNGTIAPGSRVLDNLHINISSKKIVPWIKYILPIAITTVSGGYQANPALDITYFTFMATDPISGEYTSNGYFYHPSAPRAISARSKTVTFIGPNQYKVELGDLGGSGYFAIFTIGPDGSLSIEAATGAAGAPYTMFTSGLPTSNPGYTPQWSGSASCNNTFDAQNKTFYVRYGYMGATGWRVTEEVINKN